MVGRDRGFKTRTEENGSFFVTAVVYDRDIGEEKRGERSTSDERWNEHTRIIGS